MELLVRRTHLRFGLGIEFAGVADAREAERLSAGPPDSREYALAVTAPAAPTDAIPGLTAREREVLANVVAGRTYGEIAEALVLSEKPVSVHISNMLRKTGTASRVELAQLAHRHSRTEDSGPGI